MIGRRARSRGFVVLAVATVLFVIALGVMMAQLADVTSFKGLQFRGTEDKFERIIQALSEYVAVRHRLPCPADPTVAVAANQGRASPEIATAACAAPAGVVPWQTLGLQRTDVVDQWGRLISYRVFDTEIGLTQERGASMVDCDLANGAGVGESAPVNGLCSTNLNTLATSFLTHASFSAPANQKGLRVSDNNAAGAGIPNVSHVAFVLISHGPSGLGGYRVQVNEDGSVSFPQLAMPDAAATDFSNTRAPTITAADSTIYVKAAPSAEQIVAGTAGHFDDLVSYIKIDELARRAGLAARDWPDTENKMTTATTTDMTTPSTDRFQSTGQAGSGQEFVQATSEGQAAVAFGGSASSYAGCLWWPELFTLKSGSTLKRLTVALEFAATDNSDDPFPGYTLGFLSGADSSPSTTTCGTSYIAKAGTGFAAATVVTVDSTADLEKGMNVFGAGVSADSVIDQIIDGTTISLDKKLDEGLSNTALQFANSYLISRDLGWGGGSLASSYTHRFAVEVDTARDDTNRVNPTVGSAFDPTVAGVQHMAIVGGGTIHGTSAESCATTDYGRACDSVVSPFPAVSRTAVAASGNAYLTITDAQGSAGIVKGMSVTVGGATRTVTSINNLVIGLSAALSADFSGTAEFASVSSSTFLREGLAVFHPMRAEVTPQACSRPTATGFLGARSISVSSATGLNVGMTVSGAGIAPGATITSMAGTTLQLSRGNTGVVANDVSIAFLPFPETLKATSSGTDGLAVASTAGLRIGMGVAGAYVTSGTVIAGLSDTVITLSAPHSLPDSSTQTTASFSISTPSTSGLTGTLVQSWVASDSGCKANTAMCQRLRDLRTPFGDYLSWDDRSLGVVSCLTPTSATAFDTLRFGVTTANRATNSSANTQNFVVRGLRASTTLK